MERKQKPTKQSFVVETTCLTNGVGFLRYLRFCTLAGGMEGGGG